MFCQTALTPQLTHAQHLQVLVRQDLRACLCPAVTAQGIA
jgi:hypothetical protein